MKKTIISISESGNVSVPTNVKMRDFEIADLFGVLNQTTQSNIKVVIKMGVVIPDYTHDGTVVGNLIMPDYYGLDMIIALAFRIQSPQTEAFRRWILEKLTRNERNIINSQFILSIDKSLN